MSRRTPLARITGLLEIPRSRLVAAIAAASVTLASAVALAAVSAWLVTSAWTMPPVLDLSVAIVAVRALGISRGVFRWVDRMATHDAALRGVVNLRTNLFSALARRRDDALVRLRRGDLLARLGDDAQEIGDHVIRAGVPIAVSVVIAVLTVAIIAPLSLPGALAMLAGLAVASVLAPLASYRAAQLTQGAVIAARAEVTGGALEILDDATDLRLQGRLEESLRAEDEAQSRFDRALDRAALPAALASAAVPAAMILTLLGCVIAAGPLWVHGTASAGTIGVLLLLPLSAFEAASALPAAAAQVARSRAAAARLAEAIGPENGDETTGRAGDRAPDGDGAPGGKGTPDREGAPTPPPHRSPGPASRLQAVGLTPGWNPEAPRVRGLDLTLEPGDRLAVVGPSGTGKSTLLLTLAGLLEPLGGTVRLGGREIAAVPEPELRAQAVMFAEDAHVFATTVRENLRVARGDASDEEITAALVAAGLADWIAQIPGGLSHLLGPDGTTVSGGERRRLLLARALLRRAPITLLDEPTEHLDPARGAALLQGLLATGPASLLPSDGIVVLVTHQREAIPPGTPVLSLDGGEASLSAHRSPQEETP